MPQESLTAALGTPADLDQSDGGVAYVLAGKWSSSAGGFWLANTWYRPLVGPGITCTMTAHAVSGQALMGTKDFNGGLGSGTVQVDFDTPMAISPGVQYAAGVRTNRYTYSALSPPTTPPSAFPYSNGLHLSMPSGAFALAPGGVVYPSTDTTVLYFVSPVVDINATNKVTILVNGLRRLGALARRARPTIVHNKPLPVTSQVDVRYRFGSFGRKWRMIMFSDRIDDTSTERVQASVEADANGLPYDPTHAEVQFAFLADPLAKPQLSDWKTGSWDVTRIGAYVAQCNVGEGGAVELQAGNYFAWIRITDPVAGETPTEQLGKLIVT